MSRPRYSHGELYCRHCGEIIRREEAELKLKKSKDGLRCRSCGYKIRSTSRYKPLNPYEFEGEILVTRGYGKSGQ